MCNDKLWEILQQAPKNDVIVNNLIRAYKILCMSGYEKILCSISGGSDSDVVLDICTKFRDDIDYVWFNTGVEFQATKDHLDYLENKYGIKIKRENAIKPIPTSCREYGQPFLSKKISDYIYRLQSHDFNFLNEKRNFDDLLKQYPNCESALRWWCNEWGCDSRFNICKTKWLKEFMIENPPNFKISAKCCDYAKKNVLHKTIKEYGYDLNVSGIRKYEGGARQTAYKSCFDNNGDCANYRPVFWYKNEDKEQYCKHYGIVHSRCYTEYGMTRTGCVGCPYARDIDFELEVLKNHEPKLYALATNVFKDSYEYTKKYKEYRRKMEMGNGGQMTLFDFGIEQRQYESRDIPGM